MLVIAESSFTIITNDYDCHIPTKVLQITPNRFYNKTDTRVSKHTGETHENIWGIWELSHVSLPGRDVVISEHIDYFRKMLYDKMDVIKSLKEKYDFTCVFTLSIDTEDVWGMDLMAEDLSFLNQICDRFTCFFTTKKIEF